MRKYEMYVCARNEGDSIKITDLFSDMDSAVDLAVDLGEDVFKVNMFAPASPLEYELVYISSVSVYDLLSNMLEEAETTQDIDDLIAKVDLQIRNRMVER